MAPAGAEFACLQRPPNAPGQRRRAPERTLRCGRAVRRQSFAPVVVPAATERLLLVPTGRSYAGQAGAQATRAYIRSA